MEVAERHAEKKSITLIEAYKKDEKVVYREIEKKKAEQTHERINFDPFEEKLKAKIHELNRGLMDIEIKLQQALTDSRNAFFRHVQ